MKTFLLSVILLPLFVSAQPAMQHCYLKVTDSVALSKPTIETTTKILHKRLLKHGYKSSSVTYNKQANNFVITGNDILDTNFIKILLVKPDIPTPNTR